MQQELNQDFKYKKSGFVVESVNAFTFLAVGVGTAVIVMIMVGVLAGQMYQQNETKITDIVNQTVEDNVREGIVSGFKAYKQTGDYMPLLVLAIIMGLVLAIILGLTLRGAGGGGGGSAL